MDADFRLYAPACVKLKKKKVDHSEQQDEADKELDDENQAV